MYVSISVLVFVCWNYYTFIVILCNKGDLCTCVKQLYIPFASCVIILQAAADSLNPFFSYISDSLSALYLKQRLWLMKKLTKIHDIALQNNSALQYMFITAVSQTNIFSLSMSLEAFFLHWKSNLEQQSFQAYFAQNLSKL